MQAVSQLRFFFFILLVMLTSGCGKLWYSVTFTPPTPVSNAPYSPSVTWFNGANIVDQSAVYGSQGVGNLLNTPGARADGASWPNASRFFWLYGGLGYNASGTFTGMNDLWKYDPATNMWTWMNGNSAGNVGPTYGTKGTPNAANTPGWRYYPASVSDTTGNLWLFGGVGPGPEDYDDLWMYSVTGGNWVWVSGNNTMGGAGVYGTKGVGSTSNYPGARGEHAMCIDGANNIWVFGGVGHDSAGSSGNLNDLWKYNPGTFQWTWVSGSNLINQNGVYGTQGVGSSSNYPGTRGDPKCWIDASGNFWLFGGVGADSVGGNGWLGDLWEFNPGSLKWTWVKGSNVVNSGGAYGTLGQPNSANTPGARYVAAGGVDPDGNFWLFGGNGYDSTATVYLLNDLWKFSPTTQQWTWMAGANLIDQNGSYGTKGVAGSNSPGSRSNPFSWCDSSGNYWVFGGLGFDSTGTHDPLNDLWRISP